MPILPPEEPPDAWLLTPDTLDHLRQVRGGVIAPAAAPADPHDGCEENLDALRAEVARLTGLLDEATTERDTANAELARKTAGWDALAAEGRQQVARLMADRDAARAEVVSLGQQLDACRQQQTRQARTIEEQRSLAAARAGTADMYRSLVETGALVQDGEGVRIPETFLPTPAHPIALAVNGPGLVEYDGRELRITYEPAQAARATTDQTGAPIRPDAQAVEDDPRRPHLDSWPDDAVLLRYRELRDLVALHLDRYADAGSARAMRDGDVPLRLAEVLR